MMVQLIDDWFVQCKVIGSEFPGRCKSNWIQRHTWHCSKRRQKTAVDECKKKAECLSAPLPMQDMFLTVPAKPNSQHQLPHHLLRRVESKLESFHNNLSHFANCGVRSSLCDKLNLCGAATEDST